MLGEFLEVLVKEAEGRNRLALTPEQVAMHRVVMLVAWKDTQLDGWVQRCATRHDRQVIVDIGAPIFADGQDIKAFFNAPEEGAVFGRNLDFFVSPLKEILSFFHIPSHFAGTPRSLRNLLEIVRASPPSWVITGVDHLT